MVDSQKIAAIGWPRVCQRPKFKCQDTDFILHVHEALLVYFICEKVPQVWICSFFTTADGTQPCVLDTKCVYTLVSILSNECITKKHLYGYFAMYFC